MRGEGFGPGGGDALTGVAAKWGGVNAEKMTGLLSHTIDEFVRRQRICIFQGAF